VEIEELQPEDWILWLMVTCLSSFLLFIRKTLYGKSDIRKKCSLVTILWL